MRFTRGTYPDIPGRPGDPCWQASSSWFWLDADFNTRFPFGTSFCLRLGCPRGGKGYRRGGPGFTLDLNAPLGEARAGSTCGSVTGTSRSGSSRSTVRKHFEDDDGTPRFREVRTWPRLVQMDRYRYHRDLGGNWARNDKPEPLHWGWLTIERKRDDG